MTNDQLELSVVPMKPTGYVPDGTEKLPYATHEGAIKIGDETIRCYQLNTGQRIFDAEDINRIFSVASSLTPSHD